MESRKFSLPPEGSYCQDARPTILQAGSYRSQYSFLSTATPGKPLFCNGVKLVFFLVKPIREIRLRFYGANVPYELAAFTKGGVLVGNTTRHASPYDYQDYEIPGHRH